MIVAWSAIEYLMVAAPEGHGRVHALLDTIVVVIVASERLWRGSAQLQDIVIWRLRISDHPYRSRDGNPAMVRGVIEGHAVTVSSGGGAWRRREQATGCLVHARQAWRGRGTRVRKAPFLPLGQREADMHQA